MNHWPQELRVPMERNLWYEIARNEYQPPDNQNLQALTQELISFLGSTDGELRDDIAYSTLAHWILQGRYTAAELRSLTRELTRNLTAGIGREGDDLVFLRSFSALVLAVVVGQDNKEPFFEESQVTRLLKETLGFLAAEKDLRGFVPEKGWAHAIAHTSDLLALLARNRFTGANELRQ